MVESAKQIPLTTLKKKTFLSQSNKSIKIADLPDFNFFMLASLSDKVIWESKKRKF